MGDQLEHFIRVVSDDSRISKVLKQIEKIQMLRLWCNKALAFLASFRRELAKLEACNDEKERGLLIEQCEALYMAAVTTYCPGFAD